jgi:predicted DNA-binding antitoxin AbrB/MazE fold protein
VSTIDAIYRNGIFQPTERVQLPEDCRVRLKFEPIDAPEETIDAMQTVYEVMSKRFRSGRHDLGERHNEHQP